MRPVNLVKRDSLYSPNLYPLYFERILQPLRLPAWIAALLLGGFIWSAFAVSDILTGVPFVQHLRVVLPVLVSIVLAPIMMTVVRDKSLLAYQDLLPVLNESEHGKLSALLRKIFDQRRSLGFAVVVGTGGVVHHIVLSYVSWGRIWWYSIVDIVLIGFLWWFVVASLFWACASIAGYSFRAARYLQFTPRLFSQRRMCGLESFGNLSVVPSVAWGTVATFGTLSTFDPAIVEQFPFLIMLYLLLDFVIVASSMTAVFFLPVLGYRAIVLPLKRAWSRRIDQLMSQVCAVDPDRANEVDSKAALTTLYILALSSQIRQIKHWPLSLGAGFRFIISYVIPGSVFVARLILLALKAPILF
jgi:hypothetical protein